MWAVWAKYARAACFGNPRAAKPPSLLRITWY
jgi:hypothetical protein